MVIALAALGYLAVALLLDFKYFIFPGDAMSRMANGFYVLYSRDQHLAAIGFVWTPLTSLCDIFFLFFKGLWPDLATHDLAGSLTTVCAMAGAVYQAWATLVEWDIARLPRLVLVALFAVNPMIVFYSANGMSEAMYLFTLVATTRYLLRWLRGPNDTKSLVYAAVMLGLAFLGRNEAVAAGGLGTLLVFRVTFKRAHGARQSRLMAAAMDSSIFLMPFGVTFVAWALAGWIITKQLLAQYSVNNLQVSIAGIRIVSVHDRILHEVHALLAVSPLLAIVIVLALVMGWRRHDPQPWAVICILGGCLAFSLVSYASGSIFPWFRFYILCVPIGVLLLGYVIGARPRPPLAHEVPARSRSIWASAVASVAGSALALALLGPSLPSTARGMLNSAIAPEETQDLGFVFHHRLDAEDIASKTHYAHILSVNRYIGDLHLPDGSVVVDNTVACVPEIIVTSPNARVFVIPNDRDYQRVLADPITFHAHFLLVPEAVGLAGTNEINKEYPGVYGGTQPYFRIVHSFSVGGNCPGFRLLKVTGHTGL